MDRPPTLNDVAQCYSLFLEREVENASIAVMQMANASTLWELIRRFAASTEAVRRRIHRASGMIADMYDPASICLDASEEQRADLLLRTVARWERDGRGVAYDQLFRDPRLFDERSAKWNRARRFEIGAEELDRVFAVARRNGISLDPGASVLALGCDVGFLAAAVTDRLGRFVGVEVGKAALERAQGAIDSDSLNGCELLALRDFLDAGSGTRCDIFHSVMLLQHAPPPVMEVLLDRCLALVEPGGYAHFQLPCHIYEYHYATDAYLAAAPASDRSGEIHALPQSSVHQLLAKHGLVLIEVTPDHRLGPMGFSYTFFARKQGGRDPQSQNGGRVGAAIHHMRI